MNSKAHRGGISKKAAEKIAVFQYYVSQLYPALFACEGTPTPKKEGNLGSLKSARAGRDMMHYYLSMSIEGVPVLDERAIRQSCMKVYLQGTNTLKIGAASFKKTYFLQKPYLPFSTPLEETIHFAIVVPQEDGRVLDVLKSRKSQSFILYVLHESSWQHFTEKYHFTHHQDDPIINYSMAFSYQQTQGFFSFLSQDQLHRAFIEAHSQLDNLSKIQGNLLQAQSRVQEEIKISEDICFSSIYKRPDNIPPEYFKYYAYLIKLVRKEWDRLHTEETPENYYLQNLVCRYLHAKEYVLSETTQSVFEYLKWEKHMGDTYNLLSFEAIHNEDIFTCLGEDYTGRLVILNKAANVKMSRLEALGIENYCLYSLYYLEIYLQKRMRGYCDQLLFLADLGNLGTDNFKLSVTKRNMADYLKYCPERQCRILALNIGVFAETIWRVLKPMLPKKTLHKISIINSGENLESLMKQMDISVIPEYLGGHNKITCRDEIVQEKRIIQATSQ